MDGEDQKKGLRQKFRPFFGRIDGEDQKIKKVFARRRGPFRRSIGTYRSLKKKGRISGKMP